MTETTKGEDFLSYLHTTQPQLAVEEKPHIANSRTILQHFSSLTCPQRRDFLLTVIKQEAKYVVPEKPYNITMVDYALAHQTALYYPQTWQIFQQILHPDPMQERAWKNMSIPQRLVALKRQNQEDQYQWEERMSRARIIYAMRPRAPEPAIPHYRRQPARPQQSKVSGDRINRYPSPLPVL